MKLHSLSARQSQQGFTLLEVIVVLLIVGAVALAGLSRKDRADTASIVHAMTTDIGLIVTQAKSWKGVKPSYTGISMTAMTSMDLLDTAWGDGSNINPVGGSYSVAVDGGNAAHVVVTATGLEQSACLQLENRVESSTVGGNSASCSSGTLTAKFL